jgi:predicted Rossmann fold nucleotide-binding protein DprA/Smf involved in DNA uptake
MAEGAQVVETIGSIARLVEFKAGNPSELLLAGLQQPTTVGELAATMGRTVPETLQALALLEMGGVVERQPGGRYQRCGPATGDGAAVEA